VVISTVTKYGEEITSFPASEFQTSVLCQLGGCGTYGVWRVAYRIFVGRSEGKNRLENLRVDWRILLNWIAKKWDGEAWTGLIWFRIRVGGKLLSLR
jgi:hypothetical protein